LTHDDPITSVDFSPEGERLVTANFVLSFLDFSDTEQMRTLHLWDVTRTPPQRLQLLDDAEPWSATYAPHGDTLAAVAFDRPVRLWDVSGCDAAGGAGECASLVRELSEVQAPNTRPAFSIDGEQLAVGGESGQVYVWSTSDGSLLHSLDAHNGGVVALAFSPDGSLLASAGMEEDYDSALYLWRLSDGSLQRALSEHETYVASTLDFSPDGSLLVSADQEGLRMWDVAGGELTKKIDHLGNPVSFAFSPDGTLLASGGEGGIVHIWGVSRP
jgi:dipeptidyl aminopeptidase/acylaminoacyl peptidase